MSHSMKRSSFSSLILPALLGFALTSAQSSPDSTTWRVAIRVLDVLVKQHRASKNFSLKFESRATGSDGEAMASSKGSLSVADSGRFRLESSSAMVVCDGKTLWQYFPGNKQVIVKPASEAGAAGGILLRFLQAKPLRAEREHGGSLRLILDPGSVGESLDSLILTVDSDKSIIRSVETQDPAGNRITYLVKSLRYDTHSNNKTFTFQVPRGVETVDMR